MITINIHDILTQVKDGVLTPEQAEEKLKLLAGEELGYAVIDHQRELRTGWAEVIYCEGKTVEQAAGIFSRLAAAGSNVLATRASAEQADAIRAAHPNAVYNPCARTVVLTQKQIAPRKTVAVCTGGTADMPAAEEAAETAAVMGLAVNRIYDVGVSGLHRLLNRLEDIRAADVIIAAAGMEGALPSVMAGLAEVPVIAVPTSVGYGTGLGGFAAMLTMLNSCAAGIAVVNIDNGFGAGYLAAKIAGRG